MSQVTVKVSAEPTEIAVKLWYENISPFRPTVAPPWLNRPASVIEASHAAFATSAPEDPEPPKITETVALCVEVPAFVVAAESANLIQPLASGVATLVSVTPCPEPVPRPMIKKLPEDAHPPVVVPNK